MNDISQVPHFCAYVGEQVLLQTSSWSEFILTSSSIVWISPTMGEIMLLQMPCRFKNLFTVSTRVCLPSSVGEQMLLQMFT